MLDEAVKINLSLYISHLSLNLFENVLTRNLANRKRSSCLVGNICPALRNQAI